MTSTETLPRDLASQMALVASLTTAFERAVIHTQNTISRFSERDELINAAVRAQRDASQALTDAVRGMLTAPPF